jgi:4-diphosphocytidyl-2-C-methyl-D-erythritol kinase
MAVAAGGYERMLAPAKLNLCLTVTGRRDDGYHLLDSVVVFTGFGDRLTIRPANSCDGADILDIAGPFAADIANGPDNICLRAIRKYREAGGVIGALSMTLDKQIPVGAGLGGGSSDAAAVLRYLDRNAHHRPDRDSLAALALALGADVPVCLGGTAQHMTGIGEQLHPLDPAPHGHVVLARPGVSLSTIAVFREFARRAKMENRVDKVALTTHELHRIIQRGNDLTSAAIRLCPEIGDLMDRMAQCDGASAVQMSGSGSACFALFDDVGLASAAAAHLADQGYWAVATGF